MPLFSGRQSQRHFHARINDPYGNSCVALLLQWRGPTTVLFAVALVVVDSINTHPFWRVSHICNESVKFKPFAAYRYSSAAIIGVARVIRVCASANHGTPASVNLRGGKVVSGRPDSGAPTAFSMAVSQVAGFNDASFSAFTLTQRIKVSLIGWTVCNGKSLQFSKYLSG